MWLNAGKEKRMEREGRAARTAWVMDPQTEGGWKSAMLCAGTH